MPTEIFDVWSLRHRRLLGDDWNGDGRADLVALDGGADKLEVELRAASPPGAPYAILDDPVARWPSPSPVTGYRLSRLSKDRPGLLLDTKAGAVFLALAPR